MLKLSAILFASLTQFIFTSVFAQNDSSIEQLKLVPAKYISIIDKKIDKYSGSINSKTEKTLKKLAKWENKIKSTLQKVNPEAAEKLFGNGQLTFGKLLQQIQVGSSIALQYQAQYDYYRDNLSTGLKYLGQQKEIFDSLVIKKIGAVNKQMEKLNKEEEKNEAIQQFIKERKKQLIATAFQYLGKNKYLSKINKEAWYYADAIKNYKEIFSDEAKLEQAVKGICSTVPAFQDFVAKNSALAGVFSPASLFSSIGGGQSIPVVSGIPDRASIQSFIQSSIPATTTNPVKQLQVPEVKEELNKWRDKVNKSGNTGDGGIPDFTPNTQRSKSFKKRIEFGTDMQFKSSSFQMPSSTSVALKVGYKLNDKSVVGVGVNYVLGMGEGWDKIHFSSQGIGFRTFLKWKIKKWISIQGGSEWNHLAFKNLNDLKNTTGWKQAALLGISKPYAVSKKVKGNFQVLYDFLYNTKMPLSSPLVFRFGYELK